MKMSTIKTVDRWAGLLLCTLAAPVERLWRRPPAGSVRRVLVLKFWGIGSIIMTGYLLRVVKASNPSARVDLATLSTNAEAARMVGGSDDIVTLDISRGPVGTVREIQRFLLDIYRRKYDVVIDLEYLTRFSALATFATRAPRRAGFYARGFWRGNFHDARVPFNPYWHVRENFLNVGRAVGFDAESPSCIRIDPGGEGRENASHYLMHYGIDKPYAVINPNAGETSLERRWPPDRFAELARRINIELDMPVVVIGAASEYDVVNEVVRKSASTMTFNCAGRVTLQGLAAILEGAAVVVSNDSGPLHLASHVGAPVVGLYGPETPVLWGPLSADNRCASVLFRNMDCSPCINVHNMKTVVCLRKGAECLLDISVDDVFGAVENVFRDGNG